ncbi:MULTISPECIES: hypothetical protein [Cronobacter]|uniref:hypothetical protein n=1 Tax=Cronobacter TaxID=413496 RepID=UPI000CFCF98B|nr:hypothetical protein [Cronobacter sakazakii]ELY2857295.1 hypothetical protein [Cronobacter dublinensis]ELY3818212.1 hypothetical protein [Cronobacter sakazakii]ELY3834488.1 hypothetical protein [Cronobacter sakazakii]ELY5957534.1 hypothetical protein [Cronobacter sakazakii]
MPLLSSLVGGLLGGTVAIIANWQIHTVARKREVNAAADKVLNEKRAAEDKQSQERLHGRPIKI